MNDEMELLPVIQALSGLSRWREEPLYLNFVEGSPIDARITTVRASEKWVFGESGQLVRVPPNIPAEHFDPITGQGLGLLVEEIRTNKVRCRKHNPVDLSEISRTGDAAASLSVVDDSAALGAAGLSGICTNGKVYKLDNSAGTGFAQAVVSGAVGNTNAHSVSVFARGSGSARPSVYGVVDSYTGLTDNYRRISVNGQIPTSSGNNTFAMLASPGSIVYFILPQCEEGAMVTSVIPGDEPVATTRYADVSAMPTAGWLNNTEGTLVVDVDVSRISSNASVLLLRSADNTDGINIWQWANGPEAPQGYRFSVRVYRNGELFNMSSSVALPPGSVRIAMAWKMGGTMAIAYNGVLAQTGSLASASPFAKVEQLLFGVSGESLGSSTVNGVRKYKRVAYYARRLPNDQLQRLSLL